MKEEILAVAALAALIASIPAVLYAKEKIDKHAANVQTETVDLLLKEKVPGYIFDGLDENPDGSTFYMGTFILHGITFTEDISRELYDSAKVLLVSYIRGKSGKIYIEHVA